MCVCVTLFVSISFASFESYRAGIVEKKGRNEICYIFVNHSHPILSVLKPMVACKWNLPKYYIPSSPENLTVHSFKLSIFNVVKKKKKRKKFLHFSQCGILFHYEEIIKMYFCFTQRFQWT